MRSSILATLWGLAISALAFWGIALGADTAAPAPARIEVAHSALLLADGVVSGDSFLMRIRRAKDQSPIAGNDISITVDGKSQTPKIQPDGSYSFPAEVLTGSGERSVEIIVGHDGIREILANKIPAIGKATNATSLVTDHKQLAWWILNVVVVLIGVIALSRRKSF